MTLTELLPHLSLHLVCEVGMAGSELISRVFFIRESQDIRSRTQFVTSLCIYSHTISHSVKIHSFARPDRHSVNCKLKIFVAFCAYNRIRNTSL